MTWNFTVPTLDIDYKRGDSRTLPIRFSLGGAYRDFTGWTALILTVHSVATPTDETTKVLEMAGALDADPTTGLLYFTPADTDATDLDPAVYFHDIQGVNAASETETLCEGKLRITQDRTKG